MYETVLELPGAVFVGFALLALGLPIKFGQWTFLIAGYDESAAVPNSVIADLVGNFLLQVALVTLGFGYYLTQNSPDSWVALLFVVLVALGIWRLMYRLHSYETASRAQPAD